MKKFFMEIFLAALAVGFLSACGEEKSGEKEMAGETDDFVYYGGSRMTATPEGYYALNGDINGYYLYYITPDFSKSTILCDKLDCIHNEREVDNLNDYLECDAYMPGMNPKLEYYNGYLYIAVADWLTPGSGLTKDVVYQVSLDGTEKTLWYTSEQKINGFCIYQGKMYLGEQGYGSSEIKTQITVFPVEEPEKAEVLCQIEDEKNETMNGMKCYGDFCYFHMPDPTSQKNETRYLQVHVKDGTVEEMYPSAELRLELGDYGKLIELEDFGNRQELAWTSTYYRQKPDSEELIPLTEKDFPSIKNGDMLENMDKDYVYFSTVKYGTKKLPPEEQRIWVYDYEGKVAAEIPAGEFGEHYVVLPGTDQYLFIQFMDNDFRYYYYYVDKKEFDGGVVEAHKIPMEW